MGLFNRKNKPDSAPAEILERRPVKRYTMRVYRAKDGWRWRLVAPNGKVTADSGEAYKRRYDCRVAAWALATDSLPTKMEVES